MRRVAAWSGAAIALLTAAGAGAQNLDPERLLTATRYDQEYAPIAYSAPATHNRVWRLQQALQRGEVKLQWDAVHGYLPSLLKALEIDPDSQVLVFSSTSLQFSLIDPTNPRALYFNDDTYVGHVPGSPFTEIATLDDEKGLVFHGFDNLRENTTGKLVREGGRCLTCHDTYSMTGGGVPRVVVMSAPVDDPRDDRKWSAATETDDRTPLEQRWGGWYVTGSTGSTRHFGNLPLREQKRDAHLREVKDRRNVSTLGDFFDVSRHMTPYSDVVALMVLEHQAQVQNLITRVDYKVHTVMSAAPSGAAAPGSWNEVGDADRKRLQMMMEPLVRALFMQDAVSLADPVIGSSGFAERFQKLGPADPRGRSLRQLDLSTRLFRYPLSYQIYSPQFAALPPFAIDYLYDRIAEVLSGRDTTGISASLAEADRAAIRDILRATKPDLAKRL